MNRFFRHTLLWAGLLVWAFVACKAPLDGIVIKFKDPLTAGTMKISFFNAKYGDSERFPPKLKITLRGPDADKLVNLTGGKLIKPSQEGILGIAIAPEFTASVDRPIEFSVVAQAERYTTRVIFLTITDLRNREWGVWMMKPANPPQGVSLVQLKSQGPPQVVTTPAQGKQEAATLELPADFTGLTASAERIKPLELTLMHFDNRSGTPQAYVPGGLTVYRGYDMQGNRVGTFRMLPAGFLSLDAWSVDGAKNGVEFAAPYNAKVEINPAINVGRGPLEPGSRIPLWRYVPETGEWRMLADLPVERDAGTGKWLVKFNTTKPGFFALAGREEVCERGPTFIFKTPLNGVDLSYYGQVLNAITGRLVSDFYTNLNNDARRSFGGFPKQPLKLRLFNRNNFYGGDATKPLFESVVFDACEQKEYTVNIPVPVPPSVAMEISLKCPAGKTLDESALPYETHVQYRLVGADSWTDLAKLTRQQLKAQTYRLQLGKRYGFRASPNPATGWPLLQKDTTLTQAKYQLVFNLTEGYCK